MPRTLKVLCVAEKPMIAREVTKALNGGLPANQQCAPRRRHRSRRRPPDASHAQVPRRLQLRVDVRRAGR